jgi:sugar transferase (PEP-CTERM system associated)
LLFPVYPGLGISFTTMLQIFKKYYPMRNIFFVAGEGIFIFVSVLMASVIILGQESFILSRQLLMKILLITAVCQACLYYNDLYDLKITNNFSELCLRLLQALGFAAIFLAFFYILFPDAIIGSGIFFISVLFTILLIGSWRFGYSLILNRGFFNQKIILLGSGDLVKDIKQEISGRKDCGYTLALEAPECMSDVDLTNLNSTPIVCDSKCEGLYDIAHTLGIKKVIVSFKEKRTVFPTKDLLKCRVEGIDIIDGNKFYENLTGKLTIASLNPSGIIFADGFQKTHLRRFLKRSVDLILSVFMLIVCSPLIFITAVLIKIDSKGPVFFPQERMGEKGKIYWIHKFRSMVADAESQSGPVWAQHDDDRITRVGKFIRKLRIDELPQLYNVLKGEMSFVGPRPEREYFVKQLEDLIPYYTIRYTVKPGITGWAQVCYGYGASVEDAVEKLNYDLFYIKNMSTLMDIMIVLRTIKIVLFSNGAR